MYFCIHNFIKPSIFLYIYIFIFFAGDFSYSGVAFNPKILEEFGIDCKNSLDRNTLINLAIDYILHQNKTALSRSFSILPSTSLSKGNLQVLLKAFQGKNKNADDEFDEHLSEMEKTFGLQGLGAKDSLLNKLANLSTEESVQDKNAPNIQLPGLGKEQPKKQNLIQEMNSSNSKQACETKVPDYKMEEKFNGEDLEKLILTIKLPGVNKVSECELDISEVRKKNMYLVLTHSHLFSYKMKIFFVIPIEQDDVNFLYFQDDIDLTVEDRYHLNLSFPYLINDAKASAKFNKNNSSLIITLPVQT